MKKILIAILMFCCVPMFARGDEPKILDKTVPFSRLYDTVQKYNALFDSDFVFFLGNQISDGNYTLGNLARACVNYTKLNSAVTKDTCKNFMNDIIGESQKVDPNLDFIVTTTSDTKKFEFMISAAGDFTVDCGNEKVPQVIKKTNADKQPIICDYDTAGEYKITIGGQAKAYSTEKGSDGSSIAAISFAENENLAKIEGTLGAIFPTLGSGENISQPSFCETFYNCSRLSGSIPADLFKGISGAPAEEMFSWTFGGCSRLSGFIPANLFAGIKGAPAEDMFHSTFFGCSGLSGSIPADLFNGIKGAPAEDMFYSTFFGCSGLSGSIPATLFAGIKGQPASYMFDNTFRGCSKLSGTVGSDFFGKITPSIDAEYVHDKHIFYGTSVTFQE